MKRLLIVSSDREFMAALGTALVDPVVADSAEPNWEIARADTGLEAFLLLDRGGRPFDALLVDAPLKDQSVLAFMNRVRRSEAGRDVPVYLLSDPGREGHARAMSAEAFASTRFVDKPVASDILAATLNELSAPLQIVIAEYDDDLRDRYERAFTRAGYRVEAARTGRDAIERQPRLRAHAVVANIVLPDLNGLEVCRHVRRAAVAPRPKVVLYGRPAALTAHQQRHDAKPDAFVPAPFDDDLLVERIATLIGRSDNRQLRRRGRLPPTEDLPEGESPARRRPVTRRIPCRVQVRVTDEDRRFEADRFEATAGGLFVPNDELVEVGARVELVIYLPDGGDPIRTAGEVSWVSNTGSKRGLGVRYLSIDRRAVERLQAFVARAEEVVYEP